MFQPYHNFRAYHNFLFYVQVYKLLFNELYLLSFQSEFMYGYNNPHPFMIRQQERQKYDFLFLVFVEVKEIYSSGCGGFLFYNGYPSL